MNQLKEVYNLKNDTIQIKMIQEATLDKSTRSGLKIEKGVLFGTEEWFKKIETGVIMKHIIKGVISRVYMSGHNDYPEFEIENTEGKTVWTREGIDTAYKVGRNIELVYVEQKYKRPSDITGTVSKCVIQIKIEEQ
jgi:hypothetical protein